MGCFVLLFVFILNIQAFNPDIYRDNSDLEVFFNSAGVKILKGDKLVKQYGYPEKFSCYSGSVPDLELFLTRYNEICRGRFELKVSIDMGSHIRKQNILREKDFVTLLPWINQEVMGSYLNNVTGLKISFTNDFSNEVKLWAVHSLLGVRKENHRGAPSATKDKFEYINLSKHAENGKDKLIPFKSSLLYESGPLALKTLDIQGAFLTPDLARGIASILSRTTSQEVALRFFDSDLSSEFFGVLEKFLHLSKVSELRIRSCGLTDRHFLPYRDGNFNGSLFHLLRNLSENCRVLELSGWDRDALPLPEDYQEKCVEYLLEEFHQEGVENLLPVETMLWMLVEFEKLEFLSLAGMELSSIEYMVLAQVLRVIPKVKKLDLSYNDFFIKDEKGSDWSPKSLFEVFFAHEGLEHLGLLDERDALPTEEKKKLADLAREIRSKNKKLTVFNFPEHTQSYLREFVPV
ncbi:MAG: hypothetical protein CMM87_04230 [Rickettsiales bacterium]|nr:hypothetical protein [Rickettsiales bacterium]